jgi:hypothetical protein
VIAIKKKKVTPSVALSLDCGCQSGNRKTSEEEVLGCVPRLVAVEVMRSGKFGRIAWVLVKD